jgi:putative NADPH-quinone reductase
MNVSVILAHPSQSSFNHAIAIAACSALQRAGHGVFFHDLYLERFNPILPFDEIPKAAIPDPIVRQHCIEISTADGIIIIHPNWWGQPPAILKGWIDRVIRPGVAYEFKEGDGGEGIPLGLLHAKKAIVFNTSNTPPKREMDCFGDPLEDIWRRCVFELCGVHQFERRTFSVVVTSTEEERRMWLDEVKRMVEAAFPKAGL